MKNAGSPHRALDLPGHGQDRTPLSDVTLNSYVETICGAIDRTKGALALVAHSASGIFASQAVELRANRIAAVIFVAAVIPSDGESLLDWIPRAPNSLTVKHMVPDEAAGLATLAPEGVRETLFADASDDVARLATARLCPTPLAPLGTPVHLTSERFGRTRRFYIECLQDRAVPLETQKLIQAQSPCEQVIALDAGHSPFLTAPSEFARAIASLLDGLV